MQSLQNNIFQEQLNANELPKLNKTVQHFLSNNNELDPYLKEIANERVAESKDYLNIDFGYNILSSKILVDGDKLLIGDKEKFECGEIIAKQLVGIEGIVIFTATLGKSFDKWFKGLFNSGDPLNSYIADLIGSVSVEAAIDILEEKIIAHLSSIDMNCTNRYSPGYCDWDVSEQQKLFSFLPDNFCGIELTSSSLMIPIKSVSGIIGFGENIKKKAYACQICTQENCYLNKMKEIGA